MNKKLVIIAIVILLLVGGAYFAVQDVKRITVEGFDIIGFEVNSLRSFTIVGKAYVNNPSMFTIPAKSFKYYVILEDTGETISSGSIPNIELKSKSLNTIAFAHTVEWIPTLDLVLQLITKEQVLIVVAVDIEIDFLGINYIIPFERTIDIREYLVEFAAEKVQEVKEKVVSKVMSYLV